MVVLVAGLLLPAARGIAQPHGSDPALAEALFREGVHRMQSGDVDVACDKLADSHAIDPAGGTVLALALCREEQGRWASAWAAHQEALALAERDGRDDRAERSRERIEALKPKLSYLVVELEGTPPEGLRIARDGATLPASALGASLPVDPGTTTVTAEAPGFEPWTEEVVVTGPGRTMTVRVPALEPVPPAAEAPAPERRVAAPVDAEPRRRDPAPDASSSPPTARLVVGYAALAVGLVGLGVGTWRGLAAIDAAGEANDRCPEQACDDPRAVRLARDADRDATISTVAFAIGIAGAGAGTVLLLTLPTDGAESARVGLRGRF